MRPRATDPKIKDSHLSRLAVIYIRRSSPYMVKEHTASGMHQRSFSDLARAYGWKDDLVIEVDEDDGRSATDTTKRKGFQWLRQQVFEGKVGAIFCWEASRLARDNADFAQLLKLCAACDTLIIDEKTVYDLNNVNDNVTLGILGVMNYAESRRIGERSKATKRTKAETGTLRLYQPTGYIYDDNDKLILDPTEGVQEAFRLFFSTFDELRSATKVAKHFNLNEILFPRLIRACGKKPQITWGKIGVSRAQDILHNPIYAGTYVFGRTKTSGKMLASDGNEHKKNIVRVSLESDEIVLTHGAHEGYITWEKFTENQKTLEANCYGPNVSFKGAVRNGSALLQGLVMCGTCHWKLTTCYDSRDGSGGYTCSNKAKPSSKHSCLSISARRLDGVVADAILEAVNPVQLQLTLSEIEAASKESRIDINHGQAELKAAKADYAKARLALDAIDPEDALAFNEYAQQLKEKMISVKRLEKKKAEESQARRRNLTNEELESLMALSRELRTFWHCAAVTNAERKQLLRCLVKQVIVIRSKNPNYHDVIIHWVSGTLTSLILIKNGNRLNPGAIELMRRLAPDHTVTEIIECLHEAGYKPKGGSERFSRESIRQHLKAHGIKLACPEMPYGDDAPRGDGRYSAAAVARMFNVSDSTIYRWCELGILDVIRKETPLSAYWIKITSEQVSELKNGASPRIRKFAAKKRLNS